MKLSGPFFLDAIVASRRRLLAEDQERVPLKKLMRAAERRHERRPFVEALRGGGLAVIAELKRASPSRGVLREKYHCREIAQGYEAAGAAALSVLTEPEFFQGSLTDLIDARDATSLPVLRKDFILDAYQVWESVAAGADGILLIVAALDDGALKNLLELASELEVAALVEVHTGEDLRRALGAGARLVGVNNRDLTTFEVRLDTSFELARLIPAECVAVSESGIRTADDLIRLERAGFRAALIGERFMTEEDPGKALDELLQQTVATSAGQNPAG
jgi:indole-3-glycerol phosphate synthase